MFSVRNASTSVSDMTQLSRLLTHNDRMPASIDRRSMKVSSRSLLGAADTVRRMLVTRPEAGILHICHLDNESRRSGDKSQSCEDSVASAQCTIMLGH